MAFIVGNPDNYGGNVGIFDPAFLILILPILLLWLLHPYRKRILISNSSQASKAFALVFVVLLIPLFIYGVQQSLTQRNSFPPLSDIHHSHWHTMGTLAFSTIFIGLVGSLRTRGYFLPAGIASFSLAIVGLVSVFNTSAPSSLGSLVGLIVLFGGVIGGYLVAKEYLHLKTSKQADMLQHE